MHHKIEHLHILGIIKRNIKSILPIYSWQKQEVMGIQILILEVNLSSITQDQMAKAVNMPLLIMYLLIMLINSDLGLNTLNRKKLKGD